MLGSIICVCSRFGSIWFWSKSVIELKSSVPRNCKPSKLVHCCLKPNHEWEGVRRKGSLENEGMIQDDWSSNIDREKVKMNKITLHEWERNKSGGKQHWGSHNLHITHKLGFRKRGWYFGLAGLFSAIFFGGLICFDLSFLTVI